MANLFDLIQSNDEEPSTQLQEIKIGESPSMVLLFTIDLAEDVGFHYQSDEDVEAYVPCPVLGCPNCEMGDRSKAFVLLPAYSLDIRRVGVLRISKRRGPGTLLGQLLQHLGDEDATKKFFVLQRAGKVAFDVRVRPLPADADHGEEAIAAFLRAYKEGLKLTSAFPQFSAEELRRLPKVANRLNLLSSRRSDHEQRDS